MYPESPDDNPDAIVLPDHLGGDLLYSDEEFVQDDDVDEIYRRLMETKRQEHKEKYMAERSKARLVEQAHYFQIAKEAKIYRETLDKDPRTQPGTQ